MKRNEKMYVDASRPGIVSRRFSVSGPEVPAPGGYAASSRFYRPGRQLL